MNRIVPVALAVGFAAAACSGQPGGVSAASGPSTASAQPAPAPAPDDASAAPERQYRTEAQAARAKYYWLEEAEAPPGDSGI